jgi:hypothetical protein
MYLMPDDFRTGTETTLAAALAGGDLTAIATYTASINGTGTQSISKNASYYANWKIFCQNFGIPGMCGYEGGYNAFFDSTTDINNLRQAAKIDPQQGTFLTMAYASLTSLSGSGFIAEFPSCFQFSGETVNDDPWSVLNDIYMTPDPPQWDAIIAFNAVPSGAKLHRMKIHGH